MNTRIPTSNPWLSQRLTALCLASLLLVISVGCVPVSTQPPEQPTPNAIEPSPSAMEPQATPTTPSPTDASEALIPAGWITHTSQLCEYSISYPGEMHIWDESTYSRSFGFKLTNPDEGARNFVYVSVIPQEFQSLGGEGIYNYDPTEADLLLNLRVGESKASRDIGQVAQGFTYQRLPDTTISGYAAMTYENLQPWEFPEGTKELRYYLSLNDCTYQIGGYLDRTQFNQPGAITEDLFHQIVATIHVMQ